MVGKLLFSVYFLVIFVLRVEVFVESGIRQTVCFNINM